MALTMLRAGCKVNLTLAITGVRADGMHLLDSLFWPLAEPHDDLLLKPGEGFCLRCARPEVDPADNTLLAAWRAFAGATGFAPGLVLTLHKGVPAGAGLGGGSADAAALLRWLNTQCPHPLPPAELARVALSVGADVPFFLLNAPCRTTGIGERLEPRPDLAAALAGWGMVLLCPDIRVSTPWAYKAWDAWAAGSGKALTSSPPVANNPTSTLTGAELPYLPFCPKNTFEEVVFAAYPRLAELKAELLAAGAAAAVMSGSGSALCGLFAPERAQKCPDLAAAFAARGIDAFAPPLTATGIGV